LLVCCQKNEKVRIYKAIVLPVVLYWCETWSLTVREEHTRRVFENRVLRIFGAKRNGVTGGWRKLYNQELHYLYSLPSMIRIIKWRRMRWAEHVYWLFGRKARGKETTGKTKT
jgi:hypothetical protein